MAQLSEGYWETGRVLDHEIVTAPVSVVDVTCLLARPRDAYQSKLRSPSPLHGDIGWT